MDAVYTGSAADVRRGFRRSSRWPRRLALAGYVMVAAALAGHGASAACLVRQLAVAPLRVHNNVPLLTVMVNDRPATMVLDTGAGRSVVSREAVRRLDLAEDEWVTTTMRGVGGVVQYRNAKPRSLSLAGQKLERRTLTRDTSLAVAPLRMTEADGKPVDGLLGRDYLSGFDLDLNIPRRTVTLFRVEDCTGAFLPWITPYAVLPADSPTEAALVLRIELDGVPLRALFDSGASRTVLGRPGVAKLAARSALPPPAAATTSLSGVGPRRPSASLHQFRSLLVGPTETVAPELLSAAIDTVPIVDMILGADWLAYRHVWISYATRQLFLAL
jgi:Aspartyl protease